MPPPEQSPCVLVVEDDPDLREAMQVILEDAGYSAIVAADGREALERVAESPPRVVLMDLHLPEMSGQEALTHLRRLPQHIPVVFMSGFRVRQDAETYGADAHLEKPFAIGDMLQVVARFCD